MIYINPYLIADPKDYILNIPFQNSIADFSGINTMIAGNGSTNAPTFVAGRKGTDYAALFDGTKSIKTNANFVTGTDKVSISMWVKYTEAPVGVVILELGNAQSSASNGWFSIILRASNEFTFRAKGNTSVDYINIDTWCHIVVTADLSQSDMNKQKYYINGYFDPSEHVINAQAGNFANGILHIGQRNGTTLGFKGLIQDLRVYNRVLTPSEILTIYKK